MKSVLLTRSLEDNNETIRELEKNFSFKYICSLLVEYQALPLNSAILHNYVNIIVTSKFAARILAGHQEVEQKNVWIVGNSSKLILEKKISRTKTFCSTICCYKYSRPTRKHPSRNI